jgi:hypothetical protein
MTSLLARALRNSTVDLRFFCRVLLEILFLKNTIRERLRICETSLAFKSDELRCSEFELPQRPTH